MVEVVSVERVCVLWEWTQEKGKGWTPGMSLLGSEFGRLHVPFLLYLPTTYLFWEYF